MTNVKKDKIITPREQCSKVKVVYVFADLCRIFCWSFIFPKYTKVLLSIQAKPPEQC